MEDTHTLLKLLQHATTKDKISDFLRGKDLAHSAPNWEFMISNRLSVYLEEGLITVEELINILNESEENGKQHIFFFKTDNEAYIDSLFDRETFESLLEENGLLEKYNDPEVIDIPDEATVSQIRYDENALTFKIIEGKIYQKIHRESVDGQYLTKVYKIGTERGVNVLKIHRDGLMEVRMSTRSGSATVYQTDLRNYQQMLSAVVNFMQFPIYQIKNAKEYVWKNRDDLQPEIRFTNTIVKDDFGFTVDAKAGELSNILDNDAITEGISSMLDEDAYIATQNIYFNSNEPNLPLHDVHVLMKGMGNELVIPAICSKDDYEHVIRRIRELNVETP